MDTAIEIIVNDIETDGYSVSNNFISEGESTAFRDEIMRLEENKSFKHAGIGNNTNKQTDTKIRSDDIFWLEKDDKTLLFPFFKKMDELVLNLNRSFYLGLNDSEYHLAHYPTGGFYKKHSDAFKSDDDRKMSVILYLNHNWKQDDGGELVLYLKNSEKTTQPLSGRLVIFESHLEHEVLESNTDRYSVTGWLKSKVLAF